MLANSNYDSHHGFNIRRIILPKTTYISVSIRGNATNPPPPISFLLLRLYSLINKTLLSIMVGASHTHLTAKILSRLWIYYTRYTPKPCQNCSRLSADQVWYHLPATRRGINSYYRQQQ